LFILTKTFALYLHFERMCRGFDLAVFALASTARINKAGLQSLYLSLYNQSGGVQTLIPIQTSRIKPAIIYVINAPRYARLLVTWQRIIGYTLGKVFFSFYFI
jgi:hypothetical protein